MFTHFSGVFCYCQFHVLKKTESSDETIYIYIYIYMRMCVCVCKENDSSGKEKRKRRNQIIQNIVFDNKKIKNNLTETLNKKY